MKGDFCSICGATSFTPMVKWEGAVTQQQGLHATRASAIGVARGQMDLRLCLGCGIVSNHAFDPSIIRYDRSYEASMVHSARFRTHISETIRWLIRSCGLRNLRVLEVGCGDGEFLRSLCSEGHNQGLGIDPACRAGRTGNVELRAESYGRTTRLNPVGAIIIRQVLDQVADPVGLLTAARNDLSAEARGIYLEMPNLTWAFDHLSPWDLYYEHAFSFTSEALGNLVQLAGFLPGSVRTGFGGQYLQAWALVRGEGGAEITPPSDNLQKSVRGFRGRVKEAIENARARVASDGGSGDLVLWGAGARAVTFLNLVDPRGEFFSEVVDVNPRKQGTYIAGVGLPIQSPESLQGRRPPAVYVLNPEYGSEVRQMLQDLDVRSQVILPLHHEEAAT